MQLARSIMITCFIYKSATLIKELARVSYLHRMNLTEKKGEDEFFFQFLN